MYDSGPAAFQVISPAHLAYQRERNWESTKLATNCSQLVTEKFDVTR